MGEIDFKRIKDEVFEKSESDGEFVNVSLYDMCRLLLASMCANDEEENKNERTLSAKERSHKKG